MGISEAARHSYASRLAVAAAAFAVASMFVELMAGPGTRWGWWDYRIGFSIIRWTVWCGLAAAAISLLAVIVAAREGLRRGIVFGVHGLIIGALGFGVPWYVISEGHKVPPIHDISTDTDNPPHFVAVLPLRRNAANTAAYGGPELAAQQKRGYPDLAPAQLDLPPRAAFDRALNVARASGWEIVAAVPQENRIEATATTLWFGFKDDIVIRITPYGNGSRVDVRSVSRVGRSDLGTNAKRIRQFLKDLSASKSG